jgi:hypothetical protein
VAGARCGGLRFGGFRFHAVAPLCLSIGPHPNPLPAGEGTVLLPPSSRVPHPSPLFGGPILNCCLKATSKS